MSSSGLRKEIPGWVGVAIAVVIVLVLAVVGYRFFTASAARKPGTYPPEAYQPPGYAQPAQPSGTQAPGR